jgi:hypothetical protein
MKTEDLPVLHLGGSPRENGRLHGEILRADIKSAIDLWQSTATLPAGTTFQEAVESLIQNTSFVAQIKAHVPDLLEEIEGIAEGANQDRNLVLAFQLGDEMRWFFRDQDARADRCSAIGAAGLVREPTIVAQNIDVGSWADGMQVLLRIRDLHDESETLVFTVAGMVAMNGVSGRGFGLCCNTLLQLSPNPRGLPVAAVVRRTLASQTAAEALHVLRTIPHASGQNYLFGSRGEIHNLECGGSGVAEYRHGARIDRVIHTNHPLVHKDATFPLGSLLETSSRLRLESLDRHFASTTGPSTYEEAVRVLQARDDPDFPVCRETELDRSDPYWMTIAATIFEIGDTVRMHCAAGPPTQSQFVCFDVNPPRCCA